MQKAVVTGYGVVGPKFSNIDEFRDVIKNGKTVFTVTNKYSPNEDQYLAFGLVEEDFNEVEEYKLKKMPRASKLAFVAALQAIRMANLENMLEGKRVAVLIGSSIGGGAEIERNVLTMHNEGYRKLPLLSVAEMHNHSISLVISTLFKTVGPVITISSSCTSSADALLIAKTLLDTNQVDICIVGGAESSITKTCASAFLKTRVLSAEPDADKAGIPFHKPYTGFVMSEGAAVIVLEKEKSAVNRNTPIYGVIENIYMNNDAVAFYTSDTVGYPMLDCLSNALKGHVPTYIHSQALGIKENDEVERFVHRELFNNQIPITSIKGSIGQVVGAAGMFQVITSVMSISEGFIPMTKTDGSGFEEMPIVYKTIEQEVESVGITTHGYGGNNNCILVTKYHGN